MLLEDDKLSQSDQAILAQVLSSLKLTFDKETRKEDPDWFTGLFDLGWGGYCYEPPSDICVFLNSYYM